ncbi:carboxylesterase family protein [Dactylosporangium sp. CA-092794]|uniref:carboxylesterase family protein n=1 Tax=Dactylosporangium sp. CA-092794 TaxID=3239929 RepID=UPI003D92BD19
MDMQAALRWVRANIAGFGGDPGNVTLFGESSGADAVLAHLVSPAAAGLFHKAIVQSCGAEGVIELPTLDETAAVGAALIAAAGCDEHTAENLRALTTAQLIAANGMATAPLGATPYQIGIVIDGEILPEQPGPLLAEGRFNQVPVINGTNRDEFTWFLGLLELATGQVVTADVYSESIAALLAAFRHHALVGVDVPASAMPAILDRYPVTDYPSPSEAVSTALGDCGAISAGGRLTSRLLRRHVPVYAYEWDVPDSPVAWPSASFPYKSGHAQELQYLFPRFAGGCGAPADLSPDQARLAEQMVAYWTAFARTGSPGGLSQWMVYDADADNVMELTVDGPRMRDGFGARHHSDFWDQFYPLAAVAAEPTPATDEGA